MNSNVKGKSFIQVHFPVSSPACEHGWVKVALIAVVIAYLSLILFIPALNVFMQAFKGGRSLLQNLKEPAFFHAAKLTVLIALIVVPLNTVFGLCAAWVIARNHFEVDPFN